jgi:hypothetical protein
VLRTRVSFICDMPAANPRGFKSIPHALHVALPGDLAALVR